MQDTHIKRQIKAFRAPVFNETVAEKQDLINREFPGIYPCAPILDILFCNHILNNSPKSESWGNVVRYSIKLPSFHQRIIQPRVVRCYRRPNKKSFLLKRYTCYDGLLAYHFFDPIFFTSIVPIHVENVDIMSDHNAKLLALDQLKYCLNNIQAKSVLSVSSMFPGKNYKLCHLFYDDSYRKGYPILKKKPDAVSTTCSPTPKTYASKRSY